MTINSFAIDAEKCTGCQLCVIACKDEHVGHAYAPWTKPQPDTGHFWVGLRSLERGSIPKVSVTHMPVMCQHCADAPCVTACPTGAIKTRDDGLVWIDPALCNGCGKCKDACPYGVIYFNDALHVAQKCTGCAHRVDAGELPRCVDVCPHDAIEFGPAASQGPGLVPLEPEHGAAPRTLWRGLPKPWIAATIVDRSSEEVVPGAAVVAIEETAGTRVSTLSDAFGDFWLKHLETGKRYRIEIKAQGFQPFGMTVTCDDARNLGTIEMLRA